MMRNDGFEVTCADESLGGLADSVASHVISKLCERQVQTEAGVRQFSLRYLLRAVLKRSDFDPLEVLAELRGQRLTLDAIIDQYIPETAKEMGEMWMTSRLDFAGVTIGTLRLQSLLSEASAEMTAFFNGSRPDLSALVVVPPGEQHFLGANIVAAQLRRLGCAAYMSFAENPDELSKRVECEQPDMVLLTCSRLQGLAVIAGTVKLLRASVDPAPVLALGGALQGDVDRIKETTDVDIVTRSAKSVVGFCTKRLHALARK